jgi:hypothetical protein
MAGAVCGGGEADVGRGEAISSGETKLAEPFLLASKMALAIGDVGAAGGRGGNGGGSCSGEAGGGTKAVGGDDGGGASQEARSKAAIAGSRNPVDRISRDRERAAYTCTILYANPDPGCLGDQMQVDGEAPQRALQPFREGPAQ